MCTGVWEMITFCTFLGAVTFIQYTQGSQIKVRTLRQASDNRCTLPPHPQFGGWTVYDDVSSQLSPGDSVPPRTVLELSCQDKYKLDGDDTVSCVRGKWKPEIGKCLLTCPTINSTSVMTVTCSLNEKTLTSCANVFDGTVARFQCARFYEDQAQERDPFRLCSNGNWIGSLPTCVPICGKPAPKKDPTLIIGGTEAEKWDYPWQIALYNATDKDLLCGGTLLNQRVIITAAHCITNGKGKLLPKERYIVAAGKYYRQYDHPDDRNDTQLSSIHEMYIPSQYKAHIQNYFGDIAVIITTKIFDLSNSVRPICVLWEPRRYQVLADPSRATQVYVSGWGFTAEYKNPSNVLKHLKVPLITDEECTRRLPEEDVEYMTDDKMCGGFLNSSTAVCKGDSGGGLVSKFRKRYYIIGVVSIAPQGSSENGGCNSQLYTLYTRFSYYIESFILQKEARFRPRLDCQDGGTCDNDVPVTAPPTSTETTTISSNRGCTLPDHPKSGRWKVFGATNSLQPGMSVASETILRIECNQNLKLDGQNIVLCSNGKWSSALPRCLKTCPPRLSTAVTKVTCSYNGREFENCTEPIEGTIAKYQCAPFYEDVQLSRRPVHICSDGSWDQPAPQCVPVCGLKPMPPSSLIQQGVNKTVAYPWHVSIYKKRDSNQLICSGVLLSQKIILTVAHCITGHRGELKPKEDYFVTVGNMYKNLNDTRNTETQSSEVADMLIPKEYRGELQNYLGDIALLVMEKTFTLSRNVLPACLDVTQNYKLPENEYGLISSWSLLKPNSTDKLKEYRGYALSHKKCRENVPEDFEIYLTHDKICARIPQNGTDCQISSGDGLVYKHDGRYYITGLASLSPSLNFGSDGQRQCNENGLYTDVSYYLNQFILKKLTERHDA